VKVLLDTHAAPVLVGGAGTALADCAQPARPDLNTRACSVRSHVGDLSEISGRQASPARAAGVYLRKRIRQSDLAYEPISDEAIFRSVGLPPHHHDPFDRLLIATAQDP